MGKKIHFLTLYAFSTENWNRPQKEINYLFKLLENFLSKKIKDLSFPQKLCSDQDTWRQSSIADWSVFQTVPHRMAPLLLVLVRL